MTIDFCEQFRSLRLRDENLAKLLLLNDYVRLPNKKMPYSQIVIRANRQARVNQIPKLPHSDSPDSLVINRLHANLISIKLAHTSGQSRAYIPIYLSVVNGRPLARNWIDSQSQGPSFFFARRNLGTKTPEIRSSCRRGLKSTRRRRGELFSENNEVIP